MTPLAEWLADRTNGSPEVLRERVLAWVERNRAPGAPAQRLAAAGRTALMAATGAPGDRSIALDLLAADALVTLALLHQAEHDADGLAGFASEVRLAGAATA